MRLYEANFVVQAYAVNRLAVRTMWPTCCRGLHGRVAAAGRVAVRTTAFWPREALAKRYRERQPLALGRDAGHGSRRHMPPETGRRFSADLRGDQVR